MLIVAGYLVVRPEHRDGYLAECAEVVRLARHAPGCLDFSLSADLLDAGRVNILERWESQAAVEAFRGSGPSSDLAAQISSGSVAEYDVAAERSLM